MILNIAYKKINYHLLSSYRCSVWNVLSVNMLTDFIIIIVIIFFFLPEYHLSVNLFLIYEMLAVEDGKKIHADNHTYH